MNEYIQYSQRQVDEIKTIGRRRAIIAVLVLGVEADYADMRKSFIYDSSKDFGQLMARMVELEGRFRNA